MQKITVLGIGNIIMQDEGLGVRAVELLEQKCQLPEHIQVLDGGCLGMELFPFLAGTTKLLIIDAIDANLSPGATCKYAGEEVKAYFRRKISVHEIGISEVLAALEITEKPIEEVVIVGIQPLVLEVGLELSDVVQAAMPTLMSMIVHQLHVWTKEGA